MVKMVNGKYIFNVHWPHSLGLIEGFCMVCEEPRVDLNPLPFAQKATILTTAPGRPHTTTHKQGDGTRYLRLRACRGQIDDADQSIAM